MTETKDQAEAHYWAAAACQGQGRGQDSTCGSHI